MIQNLNSKNYTVADLKSIAERMDIRVPSKATKLAIAELIVAGIDNLRDEAFKMDATFNAISLDNRADDSFKRELGKESQTARINAYMRQNGTDKLTPAQWRRVRKHNRRHGLNLSQLNLTFP